eukprot:g5280.t1
MSPVISQRRTTLLPLRQLQSGLMASQSLSDGYTHCTAADLNSHALRLLRESLQFSFPGPLASHDTMLSTQLD